MAGQVKWTLGAWSDLEEIANYIARDSAAYAAAFVRDVRDAVRSIGRFPDAGSIVPEIGVPVIREVFVKSHRLIYQTSATATYIIAIVHGSRDLPALWNLQFPDAETEEP